MPHFVVPASALDIYSGTLLICGLLAHSACILESTGYANEKIGGRFKSEGLEDIFQELYDAALFAEVCFPQRLK